MKTLCDPEREGEARLAERGLTPEALRAAVGQQIGLLPDDVLLACGSVLEGLGNAKSDIDLILITHRYDHRRDFEREQLLAVGENLVDLRIHARRTTEGLLDRLSTWYVQADNPRQAKAFDYDDQKLLHRLLHGLPLAGRERWLGLKARAPSDALERHMLDWSVYFAETFQLDLAGFGSVDDAPSMRHAARMLLGHCLDACLALHGFTNPNPKWRARMLQQLPPDWERILPGRASGLSALQLWLRLESFEDRNVIARCQEICTLARRVLPTARDMRRPDWGWLAVPQSKSAPADVNTTRRLPQLDLDIAVREKSGAYEAFRLNTGRKIFRLTLEQYSALTFFDGITTAAEAAAVTSAEAVSQVEAVVTEGRFWAGVALDVYAFRELLSR